MRVTDTRKVVPNNQVSPSKERFVAYGLRGPVALKVACTRIAAEETQRAGYPVSVSAIMRKFIQDGCRGWQK